MADSDPDRNNPISPYYPSETPSLSGNGRKWFAILVVLTFLLNAIYQILSLLQLV
jgi:hypothetical protein